MPPQGGGGKGKVVGIVVGIVVVVALVTGGIFLFGPSGVAGSDKEYTLTAPQTVLNGEYTKAPGSNTSTTTNTVELGAIGVTDPHNKHASYKAGSGITAKQLSFGGVYGKVEDPDKAIDGVFTKTRQKQEQQGGKATLEGTAQQQDPAGLSDDTTMKCQYIKADTGAAASPGAPSSVKIPMCVWADHSTVGAVISVDMTKYQSGGATSLPEAATNTKSLLDDVRHEKK